MLVGFFLSSPTLVYSRRGPCFGPVASTLDPSSLLATPTLLHLYCPLQFWIVGDIPHPLPDLGRLGTRSLSVCSIFHLQDCCLRHHTSASTGLWSTRSGIPPLTLTSAFPGQAGNIINTSAQKIIASDPRGWREGCDLVGMQTSDLEVNDKHSPTPLSSRYILGYTRPQQNTTTSGSQF